MDFPYSYCCQSFGSYSQGLLRSRFQKASNWKSFSIFLWSHWINITVCNLSDGSHNMSLWAGVILLIVPRMFLASSRHPRTHDITTTGSRLLIRKDFITNMTMLTDHFSGLHQEFPCNTVCLAGFLCCFISDEKFCFTNQNCSQSRIESNL